MGDTLRTLTAAWLQCHGYDGLCNAGECACKNDDLMPCDEPSPECQAGHLAACKGESWCYGDCGFHIVARVTPAPTASGEAKEPE